MEAVSHGRLGRRAQCLAFAHRDGNREGFAVQYWSLSALHFIEQLNRSAAQLAMSVFQRRLASSTYALLRSFERRIGKLDGLIDDIQEGRLTIAQRNTMQRRCSDDVDVL